VTGVLQHDALNGLFAARGSDSVVCLEISGIAKYGIKGTIKETHIMRESSSGEYVRYTVSGTLALGNPLPNTGANGTANFSTSGMQLDTVWPATKRDKVAERLAKLTDKKTKGQSRACSYLTKQDAKWLSLVCNPDSQSSGYGFLGYDYWYEKCAKFPTSKVPWQNPTLLRRQKRHCHDTNYPTYKDPAFSKLPTPATRGFCLRISLDTSIETITKQKKKELVSAVADIGGLQHDMVKMTHLVAGSVVMQFHIEGKPQKVQSTKTYEIRTWAERVDRDFGDTVEMQGFTVLSAEFFYYAGDQFTETEDKVPGWAAMWLIMFFMAFLCWVAYTVQCRHMVLEYERTVEADEHQYKSVNRHAL